MGAPETKKNCVIQLASMPCIGLPTTAPSTIAVPNETAATISDGQIPTSIPMVGKKTCKQRDQGDQGDQGRCREIKGDAGRSREIPMGGKKTCKPCIPPEAQARPTKRKTSAGELHMISS